MKMTKNQALPNGITMETTLQELYAQFADLPILQKVPSAKYLKTEGNAIFAMQVKNGELILYDDGCFTYSTGSRTTVQHISRCLYPIRYEFGKRIENDDDCVSLDTFMGMPFYIRLVYEGEERLSSNADYRERKRVFTYDNVENSIDLEDSDSDFSSDVIEKIAREQLMDDIEDALSSLTEQQRKVIACCYFQGMTQQQAADTLNCKKQSISECLKRGIDKLRTNLTDH